MEDSESKLINDSKSDKTLMANDLNSLSSNNLTLKQLNFLIMKLAKEKGFGTKLDEINVPEKFALIHSEVSETYEAYRKNITAGKDSYQKEFADIIIRTIQLASIMNVDLEKEILEKLEMNGKRNWNWDEMNETHS